MQHRIGVISDAQEYGGKTVTMTVSVVSEQAVLLCMLNNTLIMHISLHVLPPSL